MSFQQSTFDFIPREGTVQQALDVPIARRTDPVTSHIAARAVTESGKREGQCLAILALVRIWPRKTSAELARISQGAFDRYQTARRLPELEKAGLVRKGIARTCGVNGTQAHEWEIL